MLLAGHATTGRVRLQWRVRHLQTQVIKFGFLRIFPKTVHQAVHITVKRICLFLNRPKDCFNIVLCCLKYFGDNLNYKAAKDTAAWQQRAICLCVFGCFIIEVITKIFQTTQDNPWYATQYLRCCSNHTKGRQDDRGIRTTLFFLHLIFNTVGTCHTRPLDLRT